MGVANDGGIKETIMIHLDGELARDFLAESRDRLLSAEEDLLSMEQETAQGDEELLNRVFQDVHWIHAGAAVFDLLKIGDLAHKTETALSIMRSHKAISTPAGIRILRGATDRLRDLIQNPAASNQADIQEVTAALTGLIGMGRPTRPEETQIRALLVEDDFSSRLVLQTFLSKYGECHVAVNGREAVDAFRSALEHGQRYDLICMDIMMPELDGRQALRQIRDLEEKFGIVSTSGAKIIMTTAVNDVKEVGRCFHELCDSYLVKPIDLATLLGQMKSYQLVQ
jgi:two-component system, chemotaxis family, chemotaxis protein CheY